MLVRHGVEDPFLFHVMLLHQDHHGFTDFQDFLPVPA